MYQFRLEALLNHRRCQEELCQKKLAQAQRRLSDEEEKLNSKKKVKRESLEKLQSKKKNTTVPDILLYMNYITKLSRDIEEQTMRVCKIEKLVDQRRQELVSTMKKRKILKKIKYKEWQAYQKKLVQDERKLMDELASIRYVRKM